MNPNNWNELNRLRIPTGRPVGYVQARPRSWTRDYLEQIQLVVRAGSELWIFRFQVRRPNHSATLPRWIKYWKVNAIFVLKHKKNKLVSRNVSYIELRCWNQVSYDHRSYKRNLSNCVWKPEKVRTSTGFEPVTSLIRTHKWPAPNVSGFIAQLVRASHRYRSLELTNDQLPTSVVSYLSWLERRTGIARSRVQTPLKSWLFQASIRNCLNCVHNCDDHSSLDSVVYIC